MGWVRCEFDWLGWVDKNGPMSMSVPVQRRPIASVSSLKMFTQRNETETKQFQNSFKTVSFQFHFLVRTV